MADAAKYDIEADRNDDHFETWPFLNEDFTGSTFKMQVRPVRDTTGTPLLTHTSGTGSFALGVVTSTVAAHVAAGRLPTEIYEKTNEATGVPFIASDSLLLSQLSLGISTVVMQAFPYPAERGDDFEAYYDVIRTPSTGGREVILKGKFTVLAGVTIP